MDINEQIAVLFTRQTYDERMSMAKALGDAVIDLLGDLGPDQFTAAADDSYFAALLGNWAEEALPEEPANQRAAA